jgi:hypothetical protein
MILSLSIQICTILLLLGIGPCALLDAFGASQRERAGGVFERAASPASFIPRWQVLIEKEVIAPGAYWYTDEKTGLPRKLTVTSDMTKYWRDEGSKMLSDGLTIPVPFEHDFTAHPMTPADKLKNNAGWVKEYRVKDYLDPVTKKQRKDVLFSVVDVQDDELAKKLPRTIRWTSPWFSSFTDGNGRAWNNVISHLALTTRPRIIEQAPFGSIAAALSLATETKFEQLSPGSAKDGFCLSRAGRLVTRKRDGKLFPQYPIAFSLFSGGVKLAEDEMGSMDDEGDEFPKKKKKSKEAGSAPGEGGEGGGLDNDAGGEDAPDIEGLMNPMMDSRGDVKMEELLCDLLSALGVMMPENVGEGEFKRALYEAAMSKIKELTANAQAAGSANAGAAGANTTSPAGQPNPLIQQEQQPMYMSLEDIQKITDPTMKTIALSMYNENVKLRAEADADRKKLNSLNDAKLKEENAKRQTRVAMLGRVSPKVKADLDAMLALPSMALSMGEGGAVVDPMATTLAVLEKGLSDIPRLLTTPSSEVIALSQPTDEEMFSQEAEDKLADDMARKMGCPPEQKKAS